MATSYIGADVDSKMTELAVERDGSVVLQQRVPTDIRSLRRALRSIRGGKHMVVEEGPMAGWLYRNLRGEVDQFVVCDPRRNKVIYDDGDKSDSLDAADLAALLRGGYVRPVYHTEDEERLALKETVALYHDRVQEAVRQINKLRGCARAHGVRIPRRALTDRSVRAEWLSRVRPAALVWRLEVLWMCLEVVIQQAKRARAELERRSRSYRIIGAWQTLPGIGLIRATTLFAYLDTPWRFRHIKKLRRYCGLGLRETGSGSDAAGRPKKGRVRLDRRVNYRLKDALLGATISAIGQGENEFARYYRERVAYGMTPSNARHAVGRKLLSALWGMWKASCRDEHDSV